MHLADTLVFLFAYSTLRYARYDSGPILMPLCRFEGLLTWLQSPFIREVGCFQSVKVYTVYLP